MVKKIDFHIHTVSSIKDSGFKFSMDWLSRYVSLTDVDLWLSWFEMCESCTKMTKSLEIFQSGYSDLRFLKNLKFEQLTREEKIRAIILCNTDTNKKLASLLTNSLTDKLLKDKLEIMVKNYNFNCYLEGTVRP